MKIDLRKITGNKKNVWWMNTCTGQLTWLGKYDSKVLTFRPHKKGTDIEDGVLIAVDASKDYLSENQIQISSKTITVPVIDRNE